MTARCDCHDFLLADCGNVRAVDATRGLAHAEQRARSERLLREGIPGVVAAQFPGRCGECGEAFAEGVAIRSYAFAAGGTRGRGTDGTWVAACCLNPEGELVD